MRQAEILLEPALDLAVVCEERFEGVVDLDGLPCESDVERGQAAEVLECA